MRSPLAMPLLVLSTLAASPVLANEITVTADVWADNWFAMYVNGEQVMEDSVPITTERSFNAESRTFQVSLPAQIAIVAMDIRENDTGLEYIGSRRQQMGDGGVIAQIRDASSGQLLGATDGGARCLVVHRAPVDRACERERNPVAGQGVCGFEASAAPQNWTSANFNDGGWPQAVVHSAQEVGPKDGYDRIRWDRSAELIWSQDLEQDNTILCRFTIGE
ncbi:MAG: PEBP family protein [Cohaesibacteraceae bacterium]